MRVEDPGSLLQTVAMLVLAVVGTVALLLVGLVPPELAAWLGNLRSASRSDR